ncbi:sugar ABC transporter permease [Clostridium sp. C8-1-8]|uniref:carbohydrate ABC transporter permease n=1 Tax=Clostridium sp. C8-1-8 TaxID=2698831 RepID=UPI00136D1FCF|nr:sugar ABC transporter permease [Clostridium sp. C8-1-8]
MNEKRRSFLPYLYLTPGMLIIVTLCIYPIIYTIVLSFTNLNMYHWANPSFIGIDNFIKIFSSLDGGFIEVILRTIVWTALNMIIHVGLALVLALLLNMEKLKFKGFYRTMLILPWAVPGYISTLVWRGMFNYDFGAINQILKSIGLNGVEWLSNPRTAMIACIIVNVWLATPFMMIVCLGALQSIDRSYYEVAELDGASIFQNFRYITFPLMKPAVLPAIIITLFVTFKQFDVVYLLTRGMAGKTDLVITYAYNKAFTDYNYGYSAAFSFIIFVILLLITSFRRRMIDSAEEVYNG